MEQKQRNTKVWKDRKKEIMGFEWIKSWRDKKERKKLTIKKKHAEKEFEKDVHITETT